jgi:hypothetical protein
MDAWSAGHVKLTSARRRSSKWVFPGDSRHAAGTGAASCDMPDVAAVKFGVLDP